MNELPRVLRSPCGVDAVGGIPCQAGGNRIDQARGCWAQDEEEARTDQPAVLGRQHQQVSRREQMERLFNQMVKCVLGWGLLDGERTAARDGSTLPTPETYEGCGKVKQTRSVKVKGQKDRATEEYYVYGWKVLVLIDVQTRLPLSMKVVKIEEYEGRWLVPLLEQAQANLGQRGHITTIVIDRG